MEFERGRSVGLKIFKTVRSDSSFHGKIISLYEVDHS